MFKIYSFKTNIKFFNFKNFCTYILIEIDHLYSSDWIRILKIWKLKIDLVSGFKKIKNLNFSITNVNGYKSKLIHDKANVKNKLYYAD